MTGPAGQQILANSTALEYTVNSAVSANPQLKPLKWMLHTRDWHVLYRKFGFHEPNAKYLER